MCRLKRWIDGTAPEMEGVSWPQNTDRRCTFGLELESKTFYIIADREEDVAAWRVLISIFARTVRSFHPNNESMCMGESVSECVRARATECVCVCVSRLRLWLSTPICPCLHPLLLFPFPRNPPFLFPLFSPFSVCTVVNRCL